MDAALPMLNSERLVLRLATPEDIPEIIRYYRDNQAYLEPFEPSRDEGFYSEMYWDWIVRDRVTDFLPIAR
jgi:ribosomal-protein-alanine N-acetyltransferase